MTVSTASVSILGRMVVSTKDIGTTANNMAMVSIAKQAVKKDADAGRKASVASGTMSSKRRTASTNNRSKTYEQKLLTMTKKLE